MESVTADEYRNKLLAIRERLVGDVEKSRQLSKEEVEGDVPDINDDASRTYSRQVILHLGEKERLQLKEVDLSLERLNNGEYGICVECEEEIPSKRLDLIPYTMHCVKCKEHEEEVSQFEESNADSDIEENEESDERDHL
ncbi:MAG: TraR/DksA family transcriptional regulator [Nitrospinota bacterium]